MKILHIITGLAKAAGTSVFCCEVAGEQVRAGHAVTIAEREVGGDRYPTDPHVKVVSLSFLLARPMEAGAFDVVHIHAVWDPILHCAAKWARKGGARIMWSPHGMLTPWALRNHWWKKLPALVLYQYWDLRRATWIHATAASEVEDVRRLGLKNRVIVAPLGVRVGEKKKVGGESGWTMEAEAVSSAQRHDMTRSSSGHLHLISNLSSTRTVLFLSRIQKKKGLSNLLRAWQELGVERKIGGESRWTMEAEADDFSPRWRLVIAGPDQEGHLAELQALCDELKLDWSGPENLRETSVQFIGPVYGEGKDLLYRAADVFVLPTKSENFGSVVVESLAQGTPVICTKGAPWAELASERCGWWIEQGVEPLKAALAEAMALTDEERAEMGARGRELARTKYSWRSVAERVLEAVKMAV